MFFSVKLEQGTVASLVENKGTVKVHYRTGSGEEITAYAPLTIVCDGCFSNSRHSLCTSKVKILPSFSHFLLNTINYAILLWFSFNWNVYQCNSILCMQVDIPSCFVALLLKNCELPYPNHGHIILANPLPILLYRISSTEVRCLVDIPGKKCLPFATVIWPIIWRLSLHPRYIYIYIICLIQQWYCPLFLWLFI